MKIENIREAEKLISDFNKIIAAKRKVSLITGEAGGDPSTFVLVDSDTQIVICMNNLKEEAMAALVGVLNERYDKITARLREL